MTWLDALVVFEPGLSDQNWRPSSLPWQVDNIIVPGSTVGSVAPASRARRLAVEPRLDAPAVEGMGARQPDSLLICSLQQVRQTDGTQLAGGLTAAALRPAFRLLARE
jgi:hypothetical protein